MQCLVRTTSFLKKNTSENAYKPSNLITGDNFTQMVRFYFDFYLKGRYFLPPIIFELELEFFPVSLLFWDD